MRPVLSNLSDTTAARPPGCAGVRPWTLEDWQDGLPPDWRAQVVPPQHFAVQQERDVLADRVRGQDEQGQDCYAAWRYVRTELRCDDDECYYEAPVYIETLTGWRLRDGRWLQLRQTVSDCDRGVARRELRVSTERPR